MPSALLSFNGLSDAPSIYPIDFSTDEEPIKYYLYLRSADAELTIFKRVNESYAASLHVGSKSIILYPSADARIRTDGWQLTDDEPYECYSAIKPSASVYLRPNDEIEFGKVRLKIKRENLGLPGHAGEIQVKSSGQTDPSLGNEEQRIRTDISEPLFAADQLTSTPIPQLSHNNKTIETVIETPAASSRHQQPSTNLSPILSGIAENATKGNENNQSWESDLNNRGVLLEPKSITEPRARSLLSKRSIESKENEENEENEENAMQDESRVEVNENSVEVDSESPDENSVTAIESWKTTNARSVDLIQESPTLPSALNDDAEGITRESGDDPLHSAVGSQEPLSRPAVSSQVGEPSIYDQEMPNKSPVTPRMAPSGLVSPQSASKEISAENGLKRKRNEDDSQRSVQSMVHVEIPMETPHTAIKAISKKRKTTSETPAWGSHRNSAKRTNSSPSTPSIAARPQSANNQNIQSSRESIEPGSSNRSTRSSTVASGAKVFFASSTTVDKQNRLMKFLGRQNVRKAKSVTDCDFLCVGKGELKKTSNLVMAVVSGKQIINDDWVVQSAAEGELLDVNNFLARDAEREAEWGISLDQAIQRGKDGTKPLTGLTFHFSPAAKRDLGKGHSELKDIAILAGATSVQAMLPKKSNHGARPSLNTIVIAIQNDRDLPTLTASGWRCYSKDIMTLSILRGQFDVDSDEFLINGQAEEERP